MKLKRRLMPELLSILLSGQGQDPGIGDETREEVAPNVTCFVSRHGSYRYVYHVDGLYRSALQLVSRDGKDAWTARAYTLPEFRRRGYATKLFQVAMQRFEHIRHSGHLSEDGTAWVAAIGEWPRQKGGD